MTKKERLLRAFQNREVDRVPMGFWYHFSPDDDFGQKTVDQHLELFRETGMDMIKVMCDGYFNYPNPYIEKVTCPEDWFGLTPPWGKIIPTSPTRYSARKGWWKAQRGNAAFFTMCSAPCP